MALKELRAVVCPAAPFEVILPLPASRVRDSLPLLLPSRVPSIVILPPLLPRVTLLLAVVLPLMLIFPEAVVISAPRLLALLLRVIAASPVPVIVPLVIIEPLGDWIVTGSAKVIPVLSTEIVPLPLVLPITIEAKPSAKLLSSVAVRSKTLFPALPLPPRAIFLFNSRG